MADSDRHNAADRSTAVTAAKSLFRFLSRIDVLAAVYIALLCAAFVLDTRLHRNFFYVVVLPVFLIHLRALDWRLLRYSRLVQLSLAYIGYFLLSAAWSEDATWSGFADLLRVTILLLLFLLMTLRLAASKADFERTLCFWFAAVAGLTLPVVFAVFLSEMHPSEYRLGAFGVAAHPVIGATLYGVALLMAFSVLLRAAPDWRQRLPWLAVVLLCAAFMLLSGSRGPLLALAAALGLSMLTIDRRVAIALGGLVAIVLSAGLLAEFRTFELLLTRAPSGHFDLWRQALDAIAERPWFGYGSLVDIEFVSKHGTGRSPHNLLIASQLYGGLPASLLLAVLLAFSFREAALALGSARPLYLLLLVFGLVAALFDTRSLVQNIGREWITLWLPIMLLAAREAKRRHIAAGS